MGAALNDLAYAVNDTIKDPANFKALNVLIQEMINNAVSQALNTTFGTDAVSPLDLLIGNGNTDVKNAITALANGGGVPIVRKIQRGTGSVAHDDTTVAITLSGFTNLSKMIVLLNGGTSGNGGSYDASYGVTRLPYVGSLSKSSLTVNSDRPVNRVTACPFSYQVIELW